MKWPLTRFLGVDQTGASKNGGKAAEPLCAALVLRQGDRILLTLHQLQSLGKKHLDPILCGEPTLIIADSVFWPIGGQKSAGLRSCFKRAARFELKGKQFGRDVAKSFFDAESLKTKTRKRACEIASGSNSVFVDRPFQKNIQTGTFRIWKDLGSDPLPLKIWPFDLLGGDPKTDSMTDAIRVHWLAEGYPSLLWKSVLGSRTRNPSQLKSLVSNRFHDQISAKPATWRLAESHPDFADAVVMALSACWIFEQQGLVAPRGVQTPVLRREGWIFGLT